jgi:ribosomal protein L18E
MAEQDPLKTSMAALALALESEVAPAVARSLSHTKRTHPRVEKIAQMASSGDLILVRGYGELATGC